MANWGTSEVDIEYTFYTPTREFSVVRQSGSESAYSYTINWYIPSQTVKFSTKYNGAQDVNGSYWGSVSLSNLLLPDSDLNFILKPVTNTGYGNYETGLLKVDVKQSSTTPSDPNYKDLTFYLDGEINSSNLSGTWNLHIGSGYGIKIVFVQTSANAKIKFNCAYGNEIVEYTEYNAIALPSINDVNYLYMGPMYLAFDIINFYQEGLITFWLEDSNGLWYLTLAKNKVFRTQLSSSLITIDTVVYGTVSSTLYYRNYTDDTNYTVIELGTKQVGSQYTIPANSSAGSKEHYNFQTWRYYGTNYQGGDTFYSKPPDFNTNTGLLVESIWTGKNYTITFDINKQGTSPPSVDSITAEYGTSVSIPSLSLANYDFKGWISSLDSEVYTATYTIKGTDTLTSKFEPKIYTVKFYDYGQNTPLYTQTVSYPNTVTIPNTASVQGFALMGWKKKNTQYDIIIEPNATSFQPTSNVVDLYQTLEVERVYQYTLSLYRRDSLTSRTHIYTRMATFPETIQLPDSASTYTNGKIPSGYDLCGWTTEDYVYSKDIAKSGTYTFTTQYTVVNNTVVLQAIPLYYMALTPKELISLSIEAESITLVKDDSVNISVNVIPNDWLGTVEWVARSEEQQVGIYLDLQPNDRNITISALEPTGTDTLTLTAQGRKKTWDVTSDYETDSVRIRIFDYVPISFFTKNDLGMDIPYNNNTYQDGGDETNTFFTSQDVATSEWEWINGPCTKRFPDNPTRTGYVFTGWVDADGNLIDSDHPPQNPINVYATWAGTYVDNDRDSLYLQLFNFDGNRMMKQYDMGIIQSNTETFNTGVSAQPTPTMTSVNTFITNLNCTESVSIKITRKSPDIIRDANNRILNDDSDDPLVWTNRKWLLEMRSLVDRWQSATDGIKLLYIPRGMKVIQILDQYAGIGDNYDLLGYVKEFSNDTDANNSGLLFEQDGETYVLVGYNGIISSYTDNYMATYRRVAEVSITFKLGGMKSKYQNWKDALVLLR